MLGDLLFVLDEFVANVGGEVTAGKAGRFEWGVRSDRQRLWPFDKPRVTDFSHRPPTGARLGLCGGSRDLNVPACSKRKPTRRTTSC
jgi:hypothetical protein